MRRVQLRIHGADVPEDKRFQPALRVHPPERIMTVAASSTHLHYGPDKFAERGRGLFIQSRLVSRRTKDDFFLNAEAAGNVGKPDPRKLQSMETDRDLS